MAKTKDDARAEAIEIIGGFGDSHCGTLDELKAKKMSGKGGADVPAPITSRQVPQVTLEQKPEEVR
jgi:hypothetical protein